MKNTGSRNNLLPLGKRLFATLAFAVASVGLLNTGAPALRAQKPDYQIHMDWAGKNYDSGGAVNCPADYAMLGVANAVAVGGRMWVMLQARAYLFAGYTDAAFNLVLLTQCHDPNGAKQTLINTGRDQVLGYLSVMQLYQLQ